MKLGKVSIVVPCYNQAAYLSETLNSVLDQTYQQWECVIVNDGSLDNTEEIANEYVVKDGRFNYFRKENGGPSQARNYGIQKSDGEFVLPLDADDLIAPSYVEKALDYFIHHPKTKLVYCKADTFGKVVGPWDLEEFDYGRFIWDNCIFCSAFFRRSDYNQTNGYNVNMIHGFEDWDFWLSLLKKEDVVYRINEVLFHYRIKETSRTTELLGNHLYESLIQICKNHPDIYLPYYERILAYHSRLEEIPRLKQELDRVRHSYAYRFGRFFLMPFSWMRRKRDINKLGIY